MWTKDDYQEHMIGYLAGVRAEIERLTHANFRRHDLNELRAILDSTSELLWWLIEASDADWEERRNPLEASCDELLHTLQHVPCANVLTLESAVFHSIRSSHHRHSGGVRVSG